MTKKITYLYSNSSSMKKLLLLLSITFLLISCNDKNTEDIMSMNIEDISFYSYSGTPMPLDSVSTAWRAFINEDDTPIHFETGTFEIKKIAIENSEDVVYALVATNAAQQVQTAATITSFKDGYKISERSTTCYNCEVNLSLSSKDGYWSCSGNDASTEAQCVKTSRIITD